MDEKEIYSQFTKNLLQWYSQFGRVLPWRQTTNPYEIMVSEFMLQQTQVTRVIPKYKAFLKSFPTIEDLACTSLGEVLTHWSGLGYNRRAKFLHNAAKAIVERHKGVVPSNKDELLALPGFGDYTTGAVLAFAYNKPEVVIDANVKNVFNRVFGLTLAEIPTALAECVPEKRSRDSYNALMDIGSVYYKSTSDYTDYPFASVCKWLNGEEIPVIKKYKQSKFLGSNRWYRGQILKLLSTQPSLPIAHFEEMETDESEKYHAALGQLVSEKMIVREKAAIYLAK